MRGTLAIFILAIIAISSANEIKTKIQEYLSECRKDFDLNDEMVAKIFKLQQIPETNNGNCLLACVLKKLDLIVGDKYNWEKSIAMNKYKYKDEEDVKKADAIITNCSKEVKDNSDACALTSDVAKCVHDGTLKAGLPIPEYI